jgi:CO/xanthine dehydrogenase Mo-binding subunit
MIPTTPAIVNAIRDATGIRVYSLPVTYEKIETETKGAALKPG